ncbi:alpha-1,3-mannosyl-glycoprotein 4-beta-N-acetylglucosaminyltransferase B isoform X1 [Phycodurus eques]|uniref:alpha-1,3-mannosyl-glycoprotein 4-beta-N-acetylglucosaminyltransferase B isoform X1 n=1 Tax=Phycodurus eques TaxID=693459 RepID=UPI002ACD4794|nr:alpha-1,3-mannosyl-glycoprotein 4-beta-N-acetylglucosaminyltransferase B isoform X1 [Phycodurus eques]
MTSCRAHCSRARRFCRTLKNPWKRLTTSCRATSFVCRGLSLLVSRFSTPPPSLHPSLSLSLSLSVRTCSRCCRGGDEVPKCVLLDAVAVGPVRVGLVVLVHRLQQLRRRCGGLLPAGVPGVEGAPALGRAGEPASLQRTQPGPGRDQAGHRRETSSAGHQQNLEQPLRGDQDEVVERERQQELPSASFRPPSSPSPHQQRRQPAARRPRGTRTHRSFHSDGRSQREAGGPFVLDGHARLSHVATQRRRERRLRHRCPRRRGGPSVRPECGRQPEAPVSGLHDGMLLPWQHTPSLPFCSSISARFPSEIRSGLLEVVSPSVHFYPDFSHLRESFGDPKERVRWRTKQNLDYCFLMMYARAKGTYYVQLEDDIVARPAYLSTMKKFALQQPSDDWMILEFSQLGFIGKMFKSSDLSLIAEFMLMFYKDKPIDWLLDHIMWVKVCNPEKDAKHCDRQKANLRIRFKPSLFQHVGTHSSLAGKIQKLKDKDFGKQTLHKGHANPPAEVTTSLKTYQHFTLEKAYLGEDFFWAFTPAAGDFIRIRFFTPVRIERYFFRSGNIEHPGDKLLNTSVEVLPFDNIQADKEALTDGKDKSQKYHRTEDGFIRIGMFRKGIAEGEVDPTFGPLEAMRLTVITDSPVWTILTIHQESGVMSA